MAEVTSALKTAIIAASTSLGWDAVLDDQVVVMSDGRHRCVVRFQDIADTRKDHSCTSKEALEILYSKCDLSIDKS